MRLLIFASLVLLAAMVTRAGPAVPATVKAEVAAIEESRSLLAEAIKKSALDAGCWAYTQTVVTKDRLGNVKEEVVVRYDPSRPAGEQWTPLKIDGDEPTEQQVRKLRQDHEKRHQNRRALGELLDFEKSTVMEENATTITYEVPLLSNDNQRLPPEKFRVTARVNKERRAFENVAVRLREAWSVAFIVNLKSGEGDMDFATVDPQYAPPITALRAAGEGSVLFIKLGSSYSATRADFKRVQPWSEELPGKTAPLKFLDY